MAQTQDFQQVPRSLSTSPLDLLKHIEIYLLRTPNAYIYIYFFFQMQICEKYENVYMYIYTYIHIYIIIMIRVNMWLLFCAHLQCKRFFHLKCKRIFHLPQMKNSFAFQTNSVEIHQQVNVVLSTKIHLHKMCEQTKYFEIHLHL